jgi:ribonuclease E
VKSVEAMALSFLRKVHGAAAKGTVAEVHGGLPLEVAYYLLNRKKRELAQIENDYEIEVTVKGKTSYLLNQLELETVKRETPRAEDFAKSEAEAKEAHKPAPKAEVVSEKAAVAEEAVEGTLPAEGAKKRKRRRKKKKSSGEAALSAEQAETIADMPESAAPESEMETDTTDGVDVVEAVEEGATKPKKRKRRRGKKGPKPAGDVSAEAALPVDEVVHPPIAEPKPEPVLHLDEPSAVLPAAEKPKRKRPARVKKKPVSDVAATPAIEIQAVIEEPVLVPAAKVAIEAPAPKPRRRATPKKSVDAVAALSEVVEKKAPAPRKRRKKLEEGE